MSEKKTLITAPNSSEYYVFHTNYKGYVHGDTVEYSITRPSKGGKLAEARPTKLIKRSSENLLMRVDISRGKVGYRIIDGLG